MGGSSSSGYVSRLCGVEMIGAGDRLLRGPEGLAQQGIALAQQRQQVVGTTAVTAIDQPRTVGFAGIGDAEGMAVLGVRDRMRLALRREASYGGSEVAVFDRRLDEQLATAAVTEDLSDDAFEITVELPGTVMATNGAVGADGRSATWSFSGEELRDRGLELLVSSRLSPSR